MSSDVSNGVQQHPEAGGGLDLLHWELCSFLSIPLASGGQEM